MWRVGAVLVALLACNHGAHATIDGAIGSDDAAPRIDGERADASSIDARLIDGRPDALALDAPPDAPRLPPPDVMFAPAPTTIWAHHIAAPFNDLRGVAFDADGNIVVAGTATNAVDFGDGATTIGAMVASFSPTGALRWVKHAGTGTTAWSVRVHGTHVVVFGGFSATLDFGDGALVTTTATGGATFVADLDATTGASEHAFATPGSVEGGVVDAAGNATTCGIFYTPTLDLGSHIVLTGNGTGDQFGSYATYVASFDPTGAVRWGRTLAGAPNTNNVCRSIAIDTLGNVTVAGTFQGAANFGAGPVTADIDDAFIASYSSVGVVRWSHAFGDDSYFIRATGTDVSGNVMVSVEANHATTLGGVTIPQGQGVLAILDSATGAPRMVRGIATSVSSSGPTAADADGNLVIAAPIVGDLDLGTGALPAAGAYTDMLLAGFAHDGGAAFFAQRYIANGLDAPSSPPGCVVYPTAMAIDAQDRMAIVGTTEGGTDLGDGSYRGNSVFVMFVRR